MRWFEAIRGQSEPLFLSRVLDEHGVPLGYQEMTGPNLLFNEPMKQAWPKLPRGADFSFTEAKLVYGKQAPATKNWLEKCKSVGIVRQAAKGGSYPVIETSGWGTLSEPNDGRPKPRKGQPASGKQVGPFGGSHGSRTRNFPF